MFLRFIAAAALICCISASAVPQGTSTSPRVALDSDIRIFTVAAALNVAIAGSGSKFGTDLDPDLVQRLKQYYSVHKGNRSDESQFAQYMGLAVALTDPPELKARVREEQLPDETRAILSFQDLLREFYAKAHITQRWTETGSQYETELNLLKPKVSAVLLQTDAFLRASVSGSGRQSMRITVELLAPKNSVNMRAYQNDYYVVVGPSTTSRIEDIRHSYLHFQLDDIVNRSLPKIADKDQLLALVSGEQGVDATYTRQFGLMTVESLIRAIELRMDRTTAVRANEVISNAYRSGLLLTPYFYGALQSYQAGTSGFRDAFADMAQSVSFKTERDRFQATFHSIPLPQRQEASSEVAAPPDPIDPMHAMIVEAQTAYNSMDNVGARALFEKVLRDFDPNNGSALYGLALLASRASNIEQSQIYFDRTVKSNSADPATKVWSYIYLGHIADIQCQRDRAMEYYRQAVQVGDNTRDAQASANSGLSKAFGDQCR